MLGWSFFKNWSLDAIRLVFVVMQSLSQLKFSLIEICGVLLWFLSNCLLKSAITVFGLWTLITVFVIVTFSAIKWLLLSQVKCTVGLFLYHHHSRFFPFSCISQEPKALKWKKKRSITNYVGLSAQVGKSMRSPSNTYQEIACSNLQMSLNKKKKNLNVSRIRALGQVLKLRLCGFII